MIEISRVYDGGLDVGIKSKKKKAPNFIIEVSAFFKWSV